MGIDPSGGEAALRRWDSAKKKEVIVRCWVHEERGGRRERARFLMRSHTLLSWYLSPVRRSVHGACDRCVSAASLRERWDERDAY